MYISRRQLFYGCASLPALAAKKAPERPNVVLILADGLPAWALGCYGNKEIRTPHIDRLAMMGTRFANHFAASPDAAVNRAVLLTGRTPMQLGDSGVSAADVTLDKLLGAAGYATSTLSAAEAVRFLDGPPAGKPFFLTVSLPPLRPPYSGASQKEIDLYAQTKFDTVNPEGAGAVETLRKAASAISLLDSQVQSVYAKLLERKLTDQTLVIFTSVAGDNLSHHGKWGSADSLYEEALATPMIWMWHGRVPGQLTRPEQVSAYDLAPAVCDALGIATPARNLCGRSYLLLATGKPLPKKQPWRTTVFARSRAGGMARVQRYKVILHDGGPGELYALLPDPAEKVNQFDNPQFVAVRNGLTAEWMAWKQRFSS